jgi:hypothetical protein
MKVNLNESARQTGYKEPLYGSFGKFFSAFYGLGFKFSSPDCQDKWRFDSSDRMALKKSPELPSVHDLSVRKFLGTF